MRSTPHGHLTLFRPRCIAALLLLCLTSTVTAQQAPRVEVTLDEGWRYAEGPAEGAAPADPAFDDADWTRVHLPHTWNAEDAFDEAAGYRRGVGWYRRDLPLDDALAGRRLFLRFEGANQVADVYVNGTHLGRHVGGYTAFAFDVTDHVRPGRPNTLAVRVDNRHDPDIPPLDADFTFYGGLYRDVWLVATAPVHVEVLDHAGPGLYLDTPGLAEGRPRVRVRGALVNASDAERRVEVTHRVVDPDGREAARLRHELTLPPGARVPFEEQSAVVDEPRLWSPEAPHVYRVHTEVRDAGRLLDAVDNPLGFRWVEATGQGLLLNGEPVALQGTNRHQDRPAYGNALPDWAHRRDLELIRETGFNFLRLAHYPQDPVVLEEADRLGLMVWEEVPGVNTITMSEAFADNLERTMVEMIRQHYNHPSVVLWGYMNEILLREPRPRPEGYREAVLALAQRLEARLQAEDATRLSAMAQSYGEVYDGTGLSEVTDVLGMNLYFGWYYETLDGLGPWLDSLHRAHPERPLMISEYGAGTDERAHTLDGRAFDFTSEYGQTFHRAHWRQIQQRPYLAGTAVWNQFDFGSAGRQDTRPSINQKGLYTFERRPKDIAFYYRAHLRDDVPVLHVARAWDHRAGSRPEDREQPVWVYTNLDRVELFLDGRSLGVRRVEDATATWTVPFRHGAQRVEAVGRRDGRRVADSHTFHYADRTGFFSDPAAEAAVMAVNAGAHYQFVDDGAVVWQADQPYGAGPWGHVGAARPVRSHHRLDGTLDEPLYQAAMTGMDAYRFDVPDGVYRLTVGLTELEHGEAGRRVFDVAANGVPVYRGLDLAARHGRYTAVRRTVEVRAEGGAGITVRFDAAAGTPTVSALHLRRLP